MKALLRIIILTVTLCLFISGVSYAREKIITVGYFANCLQQVKENVLFARWKSRPVQECMNPDFSTGELADDKKYCFRLCGVNEDGSLFCPITRVICE